MTYRTNFCYTQGKAKGTISKKKRILTASDYQGTLNKLKMNGCFLCFFNKFYGKM